ncbi:MAG TPA: hypothetical protein VMG55_10790 [Stellaceae bacterium]|nr:hypothetical protein [Stellaceae bacterium]
MRTHLCIIISLFLSIAAAQLCAAATPPPLRCTFENTVRCTDTSCERDTQDHFQEFDLDFARGIAEFCLGETCYRGTERFTTISARSAPIGDLDERRLHALVRGEPPHDQRVGSLEFVVSLGLPSRRVSVTLPAPTEVASYFGHCEDAAK